MVLHAMLALVNAAMILEHGRQTLMRLGLIVDLTVCTSGDDSVRRYDDDDDRDGELGSGPGPRCSGQSA